ncbi:hypothetical protein HDV00_010428 [Rhizophlyctis rosea]|nr:hypothetical protein HDV00_010428 [Rhizophlyctis rosea]
MWTPVGASELTLTDPSPDAATPPSADPLSRFEPDGDTVEGPTLGEKRKRHEEVDGVMEDGIDDLQDGPSNSNTSHSALLSPKRRSSRSLSRSPSRSRSRSGSRTRSRSRSPSPRKSKVSAKRAQQNRAAQRAFRLRKEEYLRNLESRNRHLEDRVDNLRRYETQCRDLTAQLNQVDADRARMAREIEDLRRANVSMARDLTAAEAEIARLNDVVRGMYPSYPPPQAAQPPSMAQPPGPAGYYPPYAQHHPPPSPLTAGTPGAHPQAHDYHFQSPYAHAAHPAAPQQPQYPSQSHPSYHSEYMPPHCQQQQQPYPYREGAQPPNHHPQPHSHDRRPSNELPSVRSLTPSESSNQQYNAGYIPSHPPPRPPPVPPPHMGAVSAAPPTPGYMQTPADAYGIAGGGGGGNPPAYGRGEDAAGRDNTGSRSQYRYAPYGKERERDRDREMDGGGGVSERREDPPSEGRWSWGRGGDPDESRGWRRTVERDRADEWSPENRQGQHLSAREEGLLHLSRKQSRSPEAMEAEPGGGGGGGPVVRLNGGAPRNGKEDMLRLDEPNHHSAFTRVGRSSGGSAGSGSASGGSLGSVGRGH